MRQMRWLEIIKDYDYEILYHSGKANMVADALSKKERLKMIMSFGEFIRDFEKMEIEVKERKADDHCYLLEAIWIDLNLNKDAIMKLGIDYRGGNDEEDNLSRIYDLVYPWMDACTFSKVELRIEHREYRRNDSRITLEVLQGERKGQRGGRHFKGELDTRCMDSVWLAIKTSWKMNDYSRIKLSKIETAEKGVVKLWWYSEWEHIRNTKVDVDEVVERKMLGSAVVQRTKDMIDLIRGRLVVAQDGHDTKGQRV
ncbi:hypothetical protein AgCh_025259 [Apium graveolens]